MPHTGAKQIAHPTYNPLYSGLLVLLGSWSFVWRPEAEALLLVLCCLFRDLRLLFFLPWGICCGSCASTVACLGVSHGYQVDSHSSSMSSSASWRITQAAAASFNSNIRFLHGGSGHRSEGKITVMHAKAADTKAQLPLPRKPSFDHGIQGLTTRVALVDQGHRQRNSTSHVQLVKKPPHLNRDPRESAKERPSRSLVSRSKPRSTGGLPCRPGSGASRPHRLLRCASWQAL